MEFFERIFSSLSDAGAFLLEGIWTVLSILSVLIAIIIMIHRINHYKGDMIFTPFRCIFIGAFVSLFIWWLPLELTDARLSQGFLHGLEAVMGALHGSLSLFLLEGGVDAEMQESIAAVIYSKTWSDVHYIFGKTMSVLAPLLTFGFILTFFRNLLNHLSYRTKAFFLRPTVHVFSELNERSLALAKSIDEKYNYRRKSDGTKGRKIFYLFRRHIIVFTDVFEKNEEENSDLFDKARELGAIVFKKDIASINFFKKKHRFYLISENESEELRHAERIIERYSQYKFPDRNDYFAVSIYGLAWYWLKLKAACVKKAMLERSANRDAADDGKKDELQATEKKIEELKKRVARIKEQRSTGKFRNIDATVYLFSNGSRGKSFLDSYDKETVNSMALQVVRINDIRALIYNDLDKNGIKLFTDAKRLGDTRVISAVIVGLGMYGLEMLKGLLWYCQIPGYKIKIKAFDENEDVISRFRAACPDIALEQDRNDDGDMKYSLSILCAKVGTDEFKNEILKCKDTTFVFVCLGDDGANISTSDDIIGWLKQVGKSPFVETIVYNSGLKTRMMANGKDKSELEITGDIDSFYSIDTVINSSLTLSGFDVHKRWNGDNCNPNGFYMSDYGYFSSLANALHRRLRNNIVNLRGNEREAFSAMLDADETTAKVMRLVNDNEHLGALSSVLHLYDTYISEAFCELGMSGKDRDFFSLDDAAKARVFEVILRNSNSADNKDKLPKVDLSNVIACADNANENRAYVSDVSDIDYAYLVARTFASVEHIRWNAYMRTEGFVYHTAKSTKHKMHYNLVPVDGLAFSDYIKDL